MMKTFKSNPRFVFTLLLFIWAFTLESCEKDEIETISAEATILYDGDPAVDGCGYFLSIQGKKYKPIALSSDFSNAGLTVIVEYQPLETKWSCNWREEEYDQVKIIDIVIQ